MPSTETLITAYGNIPIPDRHDEMTYREANNRQVMSQYEIRQDLMRLYERDCQTINEDRGS